MVRGGAQYATCKTPPRLGPAPAPIVKGTTPKSKASRERATKWLRPSKNLIKTSHRFSTSNHTLDNASWIERWKFIVGVYYNDLRHVNLPHVVLAHAAEARSKKKNALV